MEKRRGQGERARKTEIETEEDLIIVTVGRVERYLGNDSALTATANKSKGGRRWRRGRDLFALKSTPT